MQTHSPEAAVRALYAALERGDHGEALRPCFTEDAYTLERPNLIKPNGARTVLEAMLRESQAGANLLAEQHYEVHSLIEAGSLVIVRATWKATIGQSVGGLTQGQELVAHLAQFIEVRDGRVASIETYDCYEPFQRG